MIDLDDCVFGGPLKSYARGECFIRVSLSPGPKALYILFA